MKKLTAIGLLLLLLYNMFGLTVAVLFFEDSYQTASPIMSDDEWQTVKMHLPTLPYNNTWESPDGREGLIRKGNDFYNVTYERHENDTLYITLKTNQYARDRFSTLAAMMQESTDQTADSPGSPLSKAVKLLSDLLKVYLPNSSLEWSKEMLTNRSNRSLFDTSDFTLLHFFQLLHSPPP